MIDVVDNKYDQELPSIKAMIDINAAIKPANNNLVIDEIIFKY